MQSLDGQSVHAYSYELRSTPVTTHVGADSLHVQSVVQSKNVTTTLKYSRFNQPI